ncbi:hypothetical protein F4814DRAFT_456772 [Daldinia grandis]|nr:hypothetical protein F4814DRAFT_456772 [Daldinia grandis]
MCPCGAACRCNPCRCGSGRSAQGSTHGSGRAGGSGSSHNHGQSSGSEPPSLQGQGRTLEDDISSQLERMEISTGSPAPVHTPRPRQHDPECLFSRLADQCDRQRMYQLLLGELERWQHSILVSRDGRPIPPIRYFFCDEHMRLIFGGDFATFQPEQYLRALEVTARYHGVQSNRSM